MGNINLTKLNKNYQSDPNIANPKIVILENNLALSFELNFYIFNFREGEIGKIIFHNCYSYRLGKPNDEGFYLNDHELWNKKNFSDLEWNCFYEVKNVPESHFLDFQKISSMDISGNDLKHYIFFMKEKTFECLAKSYTEDILLTKYPKK